ncbi:drug/metabolite transporter (DMT)-like permease [Prauserella sediminis]|uniref:Drug/metabolite transporter (DMT)-like permease n=1 Tax=Prauserella sediminis TaxID=577680 RepID=A0A839XAV0_9PSEU|nr:DMT family transporter [Prauserella sediminis]MBB3661102.1 drug/metabolite transporter (DMT)-like permease [Prauserella sediminis]
MSLTAFVLVLLAAAFHAAWNLVATRVPGGARFVFCYYTVSAAVLLPFGIAHVLVSGEQPRWTWLLAAAVTAVAHVAYGVVLQRGYAVGDLSVVYPLARGCGPLLAVVVAVLVLHERPGWPGLVGAVLVVGGVLVISAPSTTPTRGRGRAGAGYGVLTGVTIAAYTLWDAYSVDELGVPPVVYLAAGTALQSLLLAPHALSGTRMRVLVPGDDRTDGVRRSETPRSEAVHGEAPHGGATPRGAAGAGADGSGPDGSGPDDARFDDARFDDARFDGSGLDGAAPRGAEDRDAEDRDAGVAFEGPTGRLWREHRRSVVLVGLLSPVAYLLVLFAMRLAPVSLVAPLREVSIVLAGLAGWLILGEPHGRRRVAGSLVVLAGIAAIALA